MMQIDYAEILMFFEIFSKNATTAIHANIFNISTYNNDP